MVCVLFKLLCIFTICKLLFLWFLSSFHCCSVTTATVNVSGQNKILSKTNTNNWTYGAHIFISLTMLHLMFNMLAFFSEQTHLDRYHRLKWNHRFQIWLSPSFTSGFNGTQWIPLLVLLSSDQVKDGNSWEKENDKIYGTDSR